MCKHPFGMTEVEKVDSLLPSAQQSQIIDCCLSFNKYLNIVCEHETGYLLD